MGRRLHTIGVASKQAISSVGAREIFNSRLIRAIPRAEFALLGVAVSSSIRENQAEEFALSVLPVIEELRRAGFTSLVALAQQLNKRNVRTARGTRWYASTVKNVFDRAIRLRRGR